MQFSTTVNEDKIGSSKLAIGTTAVRQGRIGYESPIINPPQTNMKFLLSVAALVAAVAEAHYTLPSINGGVSGLH